LRYIIEICVAIDIAIFGIAYPLIISEINKIGDKFNSNYLPDIFRLEWISKEINLRYFKPSFFQIILILTISSFLFLIIDAKPWFGWDNIFINNSAELLILLLTILLVCCFLIWTKKVTLYSGKPVTLLNYIIHKYQNYEGKDTEVKKYLLRTINNFAYFTIKTQDTHLQEILVNFYWSEFNKYRNDYEEKLGSLKDHQSKKYDELIKIGVEYPVELYDLVYRISLESLNNNNFLTKNIEYNSVSGWWLLGKGYDQITTSELTYRWLWSILKLNLKKEENIKSYWSKAHQYGSYAFTVDAKYDIGEIEPLNLKDIEVKNNERIRFLEFNYTLGGLLLQQKKYYVLNYIFNYSSSSPPDYVFLPSSINDIFYWFHRFAGRSNLRIEEIEIYFKFPDLDNYGVSHRVKYWICSYICLLYIRQFTLIEYYSFQNHTGMPILSDKKQELNSMLQSIPYFKKCLKEILLNEELLNSVDLKMIADVNKDKINQHLLDVENALIKKLELTQEIKELSPAKIKLFNETSVRILKKGLENYSDILLSYERDIIYEKTPKLVLNGVLDLMPKSSFVEDDIPNLNFHEVLAQSIVNRSFSKYIPNAFIIAKTESYLIYQENILNLMKTVLNKKTEKDGIIIIGFNIGYKIKELFNDSDMDIKYKYSTQHNFRDVFFILNKNDLPRIYKRDIGDKEISKHNLKPISPELKIYGSVLELNDNKTLKEDWIKSGYTQDDLDNEIKVQVSLSFIWLILIKKDRRIVQIKVSNPSLEQGIESNLENIIPF
jgi:hypothetical protein